MMEVLVKFKGHEADLRAWVPYTALRVREGAAPACASWLFRLGFLL